MPALALVGFPLPVRLDAHLPASLGSRPVTALPRYYGRSDSSAALLLRTGFPDSRHTAFPPLCLQPPVHPPWSFSHATLQLHGLPAHAGLGFTFHSQAHQLHRPNRVSVVRMSGSPPVAPHPALRRRSYRWFQAGERMPGRDFHPPDHVRFQSHECGGLPPLSPSRILLLLPPVDFAEASFRNPKREQPPALQRRLPPNMPTFLQRTSVTRH